MPVLRMMRSPRNVLDAAIGERHFQSFRTDETSLPHDEFRAAGFDILPMCIWTKPSTILRLRARTPAMSIFQCPCNAELLAPAEIRGDLGAVDDVLARQAGDVGTGPTHVSALDHRDAVALKPSARRGICRLHRCLTQEHRILQFVTY